MTDKHQVPPPERESLPFGERDTLQAIEQVLQRERAGAALHAPALEPSRKEHGVWGTTSAAVGGFGESYDAQVAHGMEANLPEGVTGEGAPEDARLEREVRKTLARAHVDAADLRVAVRGDHVTLYGCVREALEKSQIEARARGVPGVASVTSHLTVLAHA